MIYEFTFYVPNENFQTLYIYLNWFIHNFHTQPIDLFCALLNIRQILSSFIYNTEANLLHPLVLLLQFEYVI